MFDGRNLVDVPIKDMTHIRGNDISVIFQEPMTSLNPVLQWRDKSQNLSSYTKV